MERNQSMERDGEQPLLRRQYLVEEVAAIDDAIADSAPTPLVYFSVFIAVCGPFAAGCAIGYSSPVESAIMEELGLSTAQFSLFGSMLTAGGLFGSLFAGKMSDLIGRKGAIGVSDGLSLLGWIAIAISQEAWSLDLGRFLIGLSTGIQYYTAPVYVAEIAPKNLRGRLVSLSTLMMSCGIVVMYFVGSLIPWRILVFIGIAPSLVQVMGLFVIPESPRFLEYTEHRQHIPEVNFLGLFQRKYAHSLVIVFGLMILSSLGAPDGVTYYAASILDAAGFSASIGSITMAVVQVPAALLCVYLMDKCGRRPLLMISAGAMSLCCVLVAFMFLFKENNFLDNISPYFIVVGLWGYNATYRLGMTGIPFLIMSELFSMEVKGSAGSIAVLISSVCHWILTYTFNYLTQWSYSGTFFISAGINALAVLYVARVVPETKGRTLEEIQKSVL